MHKPNSIINASKVKEVLKKLIKDESKIEDILSNNFDKVIRNESI